MGISYKMQARSSLDGLLYSWRSSTPDRGGVSFPGPGAPLDVAVYSAAITVAGPIAPVIVPIVVLISSPTAGASLTEQSATTITGTISRDGTVAIYEGAVLLGMAVVTGFAWSLPWTPQHADIGARIITAHAVDAANGTISEASVAVTVVAMFNPSNVANLALWMDARDPAYSDTGATAIAIKPSGRVRRINQPAPLTGSWQASADVVRPFREANALDFHKGQGLSLAQPAGITLPAANATMLFAFQDRSTGSGASGANVVMFGSDGTGNVGVQVGSGKIYVHHAGALWDSTILVPIRAKVAMCVRFDGSGINLKAVVNGVTSTNSVTLALSGTIGSLVVGTGASTFGHHAIGQIACYSRAINDTERDNLLAFMSANLPGDHPVDAPAIAVVGDSIAAGFGATDTTAWAYVLLKALYAQAVPPRLMNAAIQGWKLSDMTTNFPIAVAPLFDAARSRQVLIVAGGTNSMPDSVGLSAATVISQTYALCDMAKALGVGVVLCTILPRSDAGAGAGFNAKRATVNADFLANAVSGGHADRVANVAGIAGVGADGDSDNLTYYPDKLHPASVVHALMASVIQTQVEALLA